MASYNKVILMGNLTRDPETRQVGSTKVTELGLAVSETWKDANGENRDVVCFVDVVAWNKLSDLCQQYLTKGRSILVEGRLQMDTWQTKTGEKRSKLRVRADIIKFLPVAAKRDDAQFGSPAPVQPSAPVEVAAELSANDEDLPF